MVEHLIYFFLGLSTLGLLSIACLPVIWGRAQRLTWLRLKRNLPVSLEEIEAERDHLRAQFALERRRLEQRAEVVAQDKVNDQAELGRRAITIAQLTDDLLRTQNALGERTRQLELAQEFGTKTSDALQKVQASFKSLEEDQIALTAAHQALTADHNQKSERITALTQQVESLQHRIEQSEIAYERLNSQHHLTDCMAKLYAEDLHVVSHDYAEAQRQLGAFETRRTRLMTRLAEERAHAESLQTQIHTLRRQLADANQEAAETAFVLDLTKAILPPVDLITLRSAITDAGRRFVENDA